MVVFIGFTHHAAEVQIPIVEVGVIGASQQYAVLFCGYVLQCFSLLLHREPQAGVVRSQHALHMTSIGNPPIVYD